MKPSPPLYNRFMDGAFEVSDRVELITPARFLFNAGSTPKAWNRKMLSDPHLKVVEYWEKSSDVFPNADIRGGVAITYHDTQNLFDPVGVFTPYAELNSILKRFPSNTKSFKEIVYTRTGFRLTDAMHEEHPEASGMLSQGHLYDMATNIFQSLPQIFFADKPNDNVEYIRIYGREGNERTYKYIDARYVNEFTNLHKWKILVPKANGSGKLGEPLSTPVVMGPGVGYTESFISIGSFDRERDAQAALQYIKTKLARVLLGVLKVTQDNPPDKWLYVPMQDFTASSDIDWSQPVSAIDAQLYRKYCLSREEIDFIESHAEEMN